MTDAPAFLDEPDMAAGPASVDKLAAVRAAADRLITLQDYVTATEGRLEEAKRQLNELAQSRLPDLMDEAGLDQVRLVAGGPLVRLKPWYAALLPKPPAERAAAIEWLDAHDAGDLYKTEISVSFGRHEGNLATSAAVHLEEFLNATGAARDVGVKRDIHHSTYSAWVREQVEAGVTIPLDLLGAKIGRRAVVDKR